MMLQPVQREEWDGSISSNEYEGRQWGYFISHVRQDGIAISASETFISSELCAVH